MSAAADLLDVAQRVVEWAGPGEQVEAYVSRTRSTDVEVFDGEIESLSTADSAGIGVRIVAGGRQGFAYAGSLDDDLLKEAITEARDNAAFGTVDEYLGLPAPDGTPPAEIDVYRADLAGVATERKVQLALDVERATRAADPRIRGVETASYGDTHLEAAITSTEGIRASWRRTACSIAAYALATDGTRTQTGYGYSVARHPDDLDLDKAAGDASERATRMLGATKPKSQAVTVFFDPHVTPSLLGGLTTLLNGDFVIKGKSFLADRVGEQVASPLFTLSDEPTNPEAYGASAFDAEGLACRHNLLIEGGVLKNFLHDSYTARRLGLAPNGCAVRGGYRSLPDPGSRALLLRPGVRDQQALFQRHRHGLLVQSVSGLHSGVNLVSGDFSVGVEGLMVRDGQTAEPVREATIASTLPAMMQDVLEIGSDLEWLPRGAAGMTLVIGGITLSGT